MDGLISTLYKYEELIQRKEQKKDTQAKKKRGKHHELVSHRGAEMV